MLMLIVILVTTIVKIIMIMIIIITIIRITTISIIVTIRIRIVIVNHSSHNNDSVGPRCARNVEVRRDRRSSCLATWRPLKTVLQFRARRNGIAVISG